MPNQIKRTSPGVETVDSRYVISFAKIESITTSYLRSKRKAKLGVVSFAKILLDPLTSMSARRQHCRALDVSTILAKQVLPIFMTTLLEGSCMIFDPESLVEIRRDTCRKVGLKSLGETEG
jgi:hypothetical protein